MRPNTSYIVCAVQRSGSSLLCEALKNTGLAGVPEEYFLMWEDGWWAQQHGVTTRTSFLTLVKEKGMTPNGVFGVKLMWNYFNETVGKLQELPTYANSTPAQLFAALFPNLHYIWVVRRDKVAQAVSWAKAAQTGIYASHQERELEQTPVFDFDQIDGLYRLVLEGERGWEEYFRCVGVRPFKVVYEDFVEAYEETATDILDYLSVSVPKHLTFGERQLRKQADAINEQWAQKFCQMKWGNASPEARCHP